MTQDRFTAEIVEAVATDVANKWDITSGQYGPLATAVFERYFGWRSMDSCPRDGTMFRMSNEDGDVFPAWWDKDAIRADMTGVPNDKFSFAFIDDTETMQHYRDSPDTVEFNGYAYSKRDQLRWRPMAGPFPQ